MSKRKKRHEKANLYLGLIQALSVPYYRAGHFPRHPMRDDEPRQPTAKELTKHDLERIRKAEEKRRRKALRKGGAK